MNRKSLLSLFVSFLLAGNAAFALDAERIIESLQPAKSTCIFCDRSELEQSERKFLRSLPMRGVAAEDKKAIEKIADEKKLPAIDITINFDFDSDAIRPESISDANELGKALLDPKLSSYRFILNGHTDAVGSNTYNMGLSDRRAASVRRYLISKFGIESQKLIAIGYGEERLKNTSNPKAAENRRVEVINLTVE